MRERERVVRQVGTGPPPWKFGRRAHAWRNAGRRSKQGGAREGIRFGLGVVAVCRFTHGSEAKMTIASEEERRAIAVASR